MPSGSSTRAYFLAADIFEGFRHFPRNLSASHWNQFLISENSEQIVSLLTDTSAREPDTALWEAANPQDDEAFERLEMLFSKVLKLAEQASWSSDDPSLLSHLIYNGLSSAEPLPAHLESSWQQFRTLLDRQADELPEWLELVCPQGAYLLGLIPPQALPELKAALVDQGLLAWLQTQLAESSPFYARELAQFETFLARLPQKPCWLLTWAPTS